MKRKIILIDEAKCDGCGLCIPGCPEGAIRIVNGKAKLVSDSLCDGLGACLGHCPQGAIRVEDREAEHYSELEAIKNIARQGAGAVEKHLDHLREHKETENLEIALAYLKEHPMTTENQTQHESHGFSGCPGSKSMSFMNRPTDTAKTQDPSEQPSSLSHWPIQLHLISPQAPHYRKSDLLLAADCVAFSLGTFHPNYLRGKTLAIACPKLDEGQEIYVEKLTAMIDQAEINTLTVMTMVVPCCYGLLRTAQEAASRASRKIPIKYVRVGLEGNILEETWV